MSVDQVLAQIRTLSLQASPGSRPATQTLSDLAGLAGTAGATGTSGADASAASTPAFGALLKQTIDSVNSTQQSADALSSAWERGVPGVDLARVMVETQKASVSFQALAQVRNRLVSAYQDIMNMTI
jgi:flagellar hook-basal body complex protein FliE